MRTKADVPHLWLDARVEAIAIRPPPQSRREMFNQPDGQISFFCQAPNFLLPSWGKSVAFLRPSHPTRGAARDRHETRGGMRWTRKLRLTSAADADGEVVWS
jgi:hypothetical protein